MNILEKIVEAKKIEVEHKREYCPIAELEKSMLFNRQTISFKNSISNPEKSGIIAEFKRQSPSRGIINATAVLADVVEGYQNAGASAVSVLTDKEFFGGENKDLVEARSLLTIPLLRKDFIINEYQIVEAKSNGADVILLIAAILTPTQINDFSNFAHFLGMEVLLEVHNQEELLNNLHDSIEVIGVNNRNLKDFSENIEKSIQLSELIPSKYVKISESSISKIETVKKLLDYGYQGFLIGEYFMKYNHPGEGCLKLASQIKELKH
jgi:indole-3-glycerol phosphate synthase